jgi:uncharacterized iron-regulated protein
MPHCPDEKCQDGVNAMKTEITRWKVISAIAGVIAIAIAPVAFIMWSNDRNADTKFANKIEFNDFKQLMMTNIGNSDVRFEYIKGSLDSLNGDMKEVMKQLNIRIDKSANSKK